MTAISSTIRPRLSLTHFSVLLDDMTEAKDPRVIMVGSVTGNDNTVGGGGVYPIADLKNLDGFRAGFKNPIAMADGYGFIGAKAYKDSKLCLMMLSNMLHARYNKRTGIAFSSIYPGCIAESPLFREKRAWFRKYFPVFMKYITGGFVGEEEAGQRLFQVAHDPRCAKSRECTGVGMVVLVKIVVWKLLKRVVKFPVEVEPAVDGTPFTKMTNLIR